MPDQMISLCVLLWAHPGQEAALGYYEDRVLKLLADHGGRIIRRGSVATDGSGTTDSPTEVQILELPSEESLTAYMNDPRRTSLAADRDAAIAWTQVLRLQLR
jgi:uncharacterized protein (DUF1330 family)